MKKSLRNENNESVQLSIIFNHSQIFWIGCILKFFKRKRNLLSLTCLLVAGSFIFEYYRIWKTKIARLQNIYKIPGGPSHTWWKIGISKQISIFGWHDNVFLHQRMALCFEVCVWFKRHQWKKSCIGYNTKFQSGNDDDESA